MNALKVFFTRLFILSVGRLSRGVTLCLKYGLTSGKMLDYVYLNHPQGHTFLGVWLDKIFLNQRGWKAVRQRRNNLQLLLSEAAEVLQNSQKYVRIVDVASGPASYVIALIRTLPTETSSATCFDVNQKWLDEGATAAKAYGLPNICFVKANTVAQPVVALLSPAPNLAIASGFYDWIDDDNLVQKSMQSVFAVLEDGGFFAVTNQISNPDQALAQGVFPGFDGGTLSMKMRPADDVNAMLSACGFQILKTLSDEKNMYSVTLTRKKMG